MNLAMLLHKLHVLRERRHPLREERKYVLLLDVMVPVQILAELDTDAQELLLGESPRELVRCTGVGERVPGLAELVVLDVYECNEYVRYVLCI